MAYLEVVESVSDDGRRVLDRPHTVVDPSEGHTRGLHLLRVHDMGAELEPEMRYASS